MRVVDAYKVTSGKPVNFYAMDEGWYRRWSAGAGTVAVVAQRPASSSVRLRQMLKPGAYYLLLALAGGAGEATSVAAVFYLEYG